MSYKIYFVCDNYNNWETYNCDNNKESYDEMINNLKYAVYEHGGGSVYIYNDKGDYIDELNVYSVPTVIYKIDDNVSFILDEKEYTGTIAIVDKFGTFFDNLQPYYDIYIMHGEEKILVKHIPQSNIKGKI